MRHLALVFASLAGIVALHASPARAEVIHCATWDGEVNRDITFPPGCTVHKPVRIVASNVTLDCAGGTIDLTSFVAQQLAAYHTCVSEGGEDCGVSTPVAISASPPALGAMNACHPAARSLHDVQIRNCTIRGARASYVHEGTPTVKGSGIRLFVGGCQETHARSFYQPSSIASTDLACLNRWMGQGMTRDDAVDECIREVSTRNIRISNVEVTGSVNAIYVWQYHSSYVIENSRLYDNASRGLYLDAEGRGHHVASNHFRGNAKGSISMDSSFEHIIEGNVFEGPTDGIDMYRNCGEKQENYRRGHVDFNTIENNLFVGNDVAIWVAARQGLAYRTNTPQNCIYEQSQEPLVTLPADRMYLATPGEAQQIIANTFPVQGAHTCWVKPAFHSSTLDADLLLAGRYRFFRDHAAHNTIADNTFKGWNEAGVVIRDDDNVLAGNRFETGLAKDYCIGSNFKLVADMECANGVCDTVDSGNVSYSPNTPAWTLPFSRQYVPAVLP
jgi:hypothetical protein